MKREQILLLGSFVLLGFLAWGLLSGAESQRRPRLRPMQLDLQEVGLLDPVAGIETGSASRRDPYREPRETEPLAPLVLPPPPLDPMATLLPPPLPDSGPNWWSQNLLEHPKPPPGDLDDLVDVGAGDATTLTSGSEQDPDSLDYGDLYDSVRMDALTVLYGRILDEDRYDKRPGDSITFQEVDPRTGQDRFGQRTIAADDFESFSFAKTLRNDIELRVRAMPAGAGAIRERFALVHWLLDQGLAEPAAFAHAETLARGGVELAADDIQSWMVLGEVLEHTFQFDAAFGLYATLGGVTLPQPAPDLGLDVPAGRFARSAAPRVRLAGLLTIFGLDREAAVVLEEAVALGDGNADAPRALAASRLALGDAASAVPLLERARSMYPSRGSRGALQNGLLLGRAQLALGRWTNAGESFADVTRAGANREEVADLMIEAHQGVAAAAYLAGDFSSAHASASDSIAVVGSDPTLLYLRGIAAAASGESAAEAIRDLRAAAAAAPLDAASAKAAEAFWLDVMGLTDEAMTALDDAFELDPDLDYARFVRARWARRDGDLEAARTDLRALIARAPQCAAALGELGWLLHDEGEEQLQKAEVALRRAEQEAAHWSEISLRRGINLLQLGDTDTARDALSRASGNGSSDYAARNALAWAAYLDGDLQTAVGEFAYVQDLLRDDETHPQRVYAETWQRRIEEHDRLRRWWDPFDGDRVRPQWDVQSGARLGVEPRVEDGELHIFGNHSGAGQTRAARAVPAVSFSSAEAQVSVGAEHRGEAGLSISLERRSNVAWILSVFRDQEGRLRWTTKQGNKQGQGETGRVVAAGSPMRMSFDLDREPTPPVLTVRVDGSVVFQEEVAPLRSPSGDLFLSVYARTINALPVDVRLDDVEIIYAQQ